MDRYDIYICQVYFEDPENPGTFLYKSRPVLILEDKVYLIEVAEITSHSVRQWDAGDYALLDWQQEGLKRSSTVRLNLTLSIIPQRLNRKIGSLSKRDADNITKMLSEAR